MAIPTSTLILCTGNSARSILAQVLANDTGGGRIAAMLELDLAADPQPLQRRLEAIGRFEGVTYGATGAAADR